MGIDKTIWIARNPEKTIDACWFSSEADAYEHWREWGDFYQYTAFNDAEGWSRPMDDEFADLREAPARRAA